MEISNCPVCLRAFIPTNCPDHCGNPCCRKDHCANTKATQAASRYTAQHNKKCMVCGAPGELFERFAPCNKKDLHPVGCAGGKTPGGGLRPTNSLRRQWGCPGQFFPEGSLERDHYHHPKEKPRYHIGYCSLKCFNSTVSGHQLKLQGRWWRKSNKRNKYGVERWRYYAARRAELKEMGPGAKFLPIDIPEQKVEDS
jgi:hypothetical protein